MIEGTLAIGDRVRDNVTGQFGTVVDVGYMARVQYDGTPESRCYLPTGDARLSRCNATSFGEHYRRATALFVDAIGSPSPELFSDALHAAREASRYAHYEDFPEYELAQQLARNIREVAPYYGVHGSV